MKEPFLVLKLSSQENPPKNDLKCDWESFLVHYFFFFADHFLESFQEFHKGFFIESSEMIQENLKSQKCSLLNQNGSVSHFWFRISFFGELFCSLGNI